MKEITAVFEDYAGITAAAQYKIAVSIALLLFLSLVRYLILRVVWRNTDNVKTRYFWKQLLSYVIPITGILMIGMVWIDAFRHIGTFLGLLSAGIAIALKDMLANIAGWLFIMFRKPFVVGDRIQIGQHKGDVIDLRLYQFSILEIGNWVDADQSTGRVIHIPNGKVFTEPQANYTQGFKYIWNELEVRVTFESNWQKAKALLLEVIGRHTGGLLKNAEHELKEASKMYLIHYQYLTPIVYTDVVENGIRLSVRYLCDPHKRRGTEAAIWEDILQQIPQSPDIQWAYPTHRFVSTPPGFPVSNGAEGYSQSGTT
jgi:small-conductance mechanosensitive channel